MDEKKVEYINAHTEVMEEVNKIDNEFSEFVTNDNARAFELFNMKARANDIRRITEDIASKTKEYVNDEELDEFDKIAMRFKEGEIKKLTDKEVEEVYANNGNPITLNFELNSHKDTIEFKRDFLEFRRQSIESTAALDAEIAKLDAIFEESQSELDEIINKYGNMNNLIRTSLEDKLKDAQNDSQKELITKLLNNFDYAFSLENIKEFAKSYKGRSIIGFYRNNKDSEKIYNKYRRTCAMYKVKTDLAKFGGLEEKFIGLEYNKRPNIFLFTIMYYVSTFANKTEDKTTGLFLTQFTINLKDLIYDKFEDPKNKEIFVNNIKEVIDIIG